MADQGDAKDLKWTTSVTVGHYLSKSADFDRYGFLRRSRHFPTTNANDSSFIHCPFRFSPYLIPLEKPKEVNMSWLLMPFWTLIE